MFIYRDEYYDKDSEREGIAELIIAKHRNGGLGTVELDVPEGVPALHVLRRGRPVLTVSACPDDRCDGSGFLFDEATRGGAPVPCRPARLARKRTARGRGRHPEALPRRVVRPRRRSTPDRPARRRARSGATSTTSTSTSTTGRGIWFTGDVGTGKTTLAMLVSKAALRAPAAPSRSTRCRACSACCARPSTTTSEARSSELLDRLAPSTCCTSTTSAPSRPPVGARAALLDRQHALRGRRARHAHDQPRRRRAARADRRRGPCRASYEMCGDPLPAVRRRPAPRAAVDLPEPVAAAGRRREPYATATLAEAAALATARRPLDFRTTWPAS